MPAVALLEPDDKDLLTRVTLSRTDERDASGEHVEFQLVNAPGKLTLGFLALLGVAPLYLTIERRSKDS